MKAQRSSLTVLGSSCSIPRPGRACSSYLIEDGDHRVILDFGTGAFSNLRLHLSPDMIDTIVISHMHADHFLDLIPLRYALRYGERTRPGRIEVYLPVGGMEMLQQLAVSLSRESGDFFRDVYEMHEYDAQIPLSLGNAQLRFAMTTHYITAYAIRYESAGFSLVYSADTAYNEAVAVLADAADLFLCEATLGPRGIEKHGVPGHISAEEAGRLAQIAGVKALMLTHYGAECDPLELKQAAQSAFGGDIVIADDHMQVVIGEKLQHITAIR